MKKKLGGISLPRLENTAVLAPEVIPMPSEVKLPMSMHAGLPANPVVAAGDYVKAGQLIAEAAGAGSSPVHASISGKVKSIDNYDGLTGEKTVSVTIVSDDTQAANGDNADKETSPPRITNQAEFLEAVRNSGVIGLGGCGVPTADKLNSGGIDYILVNGMECEPFISSDTRTMLDDAEYLREGISLMKEHLKPKNLIICIGDNKPEPAQKMKELFRDKPGIEVRVLPSFYPYGEENLLAFIVTGRRRPQGGSLSDAGCIVVNCSTVAAFTRYIKTGRPLISKCVTVAGSAVNNPKNVIAPIGTPLRLLFDYCGGLKDDVKKIILGGPVRGTAVPSLDMPVLKTTNVVLAFSQKDASTPEPSACIKCARCIDVCPMGLMPSSIETAFELKKTANLKDYNAGNCIECGCCAYTCPAKRPLTQVMNLSKKMLLGHKEA